VPPVVHSGEFFVVGGPVQPDRPCYVERAADEALRRGLLDQQFCYVLGPKASGKTSLMARTIRKLRAESQLAAVVDLTQIGARGESTEAGRWYYSIAYRIVRELRLKIDLQAWWQEKSALISEQRLAEFFWEIVLANTTAPVTIFFDEAERALELPFSRDLFVALGTCYSGRATEPDYQRLNFAVMGVATARQLGRGLALPLFEDGQAIDLKDFTAQESYHLAAGFDSSQEQAQAALDRIHYWVKGQPYLTQKIARAAARRRGSFDDVDNAVRSQFLSAGARDEEPLLNHIATLLTDRGAQQRRALVLLGKLSNGAPIVAERESPAQELLYLAGVTAGNDDEFVTFRNRLFKEIFTNRWVRAALPFNWRGSAIAAAAVVLMMLLPLWYFEFFPRPYIETLTSVTDDYALALDTHDKLRRFPGFGGTADRLLAEIMRRRSQSAETFMEIQAADELLRGMPGYVGLADELISTYYMRRARAAVFGERRDAALVYAALAQVGQSDAASALAANLISSDYPLLARSFQFGSNLVQWEADWTAQRLTAITATQRTERLPLTTNDPGDYAEQLTALQHVPVSRVIGVDEPGSAGAFTLQIDVEHPASDQLMLALEAPSGASATFSLPPAAQTSREIRASERSPLATLADEDRQGVWRLTLVDRTEGSVGRLLRWELSFAEEVRGWQDVPDQGLEIPDPLRTDQVDVRLSADGRLGVAWPSRPGARGALTLWDLSTGASLGDLQIDAIPSHIAVSPDATRVLTVAENTLTIWDVESRDAVARIRTQTGFVLTPAIGSDGQYVAIAEQLDADSVLYSLLRAFDGELVSSVQGLAGVRDWALGPQARYLILVGPSRSVRLMDPRRGEIVMELPHPRDPVRLLSSTDDLLLSVDSAGDMRVWRLADAQRGGSNGRLAGLTSDPQTVSLSADGSSVAYEAAHGHVVVRDLADDTVDLVARVHRVGGPVRTRLSPDGRRLVTGSGPMLRIWDIPAATGPAPSHPGVSTMALDETAQIAALGYRDGHVQVRTTAQLVEGLDAPDSIEYIGHQDMVTSITVNSARGLIASGGRDGTVRIWELASGAPTAPFMRHSEGPVQHVALSDDGRWVVSAAEGSARVWGTQSGNLASEIPVNGAALATTVAPGSATVAVGDSAGNLFVADIAGGSTPRTARAQAGVTALAFTANGQQLASGDQSGRIQLWDVSDVRAISFAVVLSHPVRWLNFDADGRYLVAQTDHWAHRLQIEPNGLRVVASRLVGVDLAAGAPSAPDGESLRLVGGSDLGSVYVDQVSWQMGKAGIDTLDAEQLGRSWPEILGLRVDAAAEIVDASR